MHRIKSFLLRVWNIPYVKHPILGVLSLFVLVVLVFFSLGIFTRHGREYVVPEFRTLTMAEAKHFAQEASLKLVLSDSTYVLTRQPGEILEQQPLPGEKVKKGRRIFLTINAVLPQRVPVPNIVGETIRQALILLDQNGLYVGQLSFTPDIALNSVLALSYNGEKLHLGDSVPKGSRIDLLLGKSFGDVSTHIPRLVGVTLQEAWSVLALNSLNVGKMSFDETVKNLADTLSAKVYSTFPKGHTGVTLPLGAKVDLWFTLNTSRIATMAVEERNANVLDDSTLD